MTRCVRLGSLAFTTTVMLTTALATGAGSAVATPASGAGCVPAIRDLGDPLGGGFSYGDGVSANGTIVGTAFTPDGSGRAVVWSGGHVRNLGVVAPYDESFAHGIGPDGTVVGELNGNNETTVGPFVYRQGKMRILPGLGGDFGYASSINADGVIVGTASDIAGNPHAVIWTGYGAHIEDLGIARGDDSSYGTKISDGGVVAGDTDAGDNERPALFTHRHVVVLLPSKGTLGAAEDVSPSGRVVGLAFLPDGTQHAQTWGPNQRRGTDLGTLPGGDMASLLSIDAQGRAAGGGNSGATPDTTHAIVWPGHGPLLTLRPLSGQTAEDFSVVRALRGNGEAVGASVTSGGDIHGTVWTCAFKQAIPLPNGGPSTDSVHSSALAQTAVPSSVSRLLARMRLARG